MSHSVSERVRGGERLKEREGGTDIYVYIYIHIHILHTYTNTYIYI